MSIPVSELKGAGKKTTSILNKMGIYNTDDLLNYFPFRWEERLPVVQPCHVLPDTKVSMLGAISGFHVGYKGNINASVSDNLATVNLVWFNNNWVTRMIEPGKLYVFTGKTSQFAGKISIVQPSFMEWDEYRKSIGAFFPVYHLKSGIKNEKLFGFVLQTIGMIEDGNDRLPAEIMDEYNLISHFDAIRCIHFPANRNVLEAAKKRLKFDEFFNLIFAVRYMAFSRGLNSFSFTGENSMNKAVESLPYNLTGSQKEALNSIIKDLSGTLVANRMIQGDVGCGKTAVALLSMLYASDNGNQSVLMAPTEVLATQHYKEMCSLIDKAGLKDKYKVVLLTGSLKEKEKKEIRKQIEDGSVNIIIGTHALIQDKTTYSSLAFVVIDEQHRFGVEQRDAFLSKATKPVHVVLMTATPIPRTTAGILFGGMDITVMKDKPADRLAVKSCAVPYSKRPSVYNLIQKEINEGRQAYVICPMVEEDEKDGGKENVEGYVKQISTIFHGTEIKGLHGKMDPKEKQDVMDSFSSGKTKILVSTTVIEVGVNVPNASVILIENADMFGMLQLHQLRGRVGRGDAQSYCIFMSSKDYVDEKLQTVASTNNGFEIAEADYRMRKAGNLLGTKQSGDMGFKIADVIEDEEILAMAEAAVEKIISVRI